MQDRQKSHTKFVVIILLLTMLFAAFVIYFTFLRKPNQGVKVDGTYLVEATPIQNFKLTDNKGKSFSKKNLQGHWTMMFFGFTNCGYVCPTTMAALNDMYKILQKDLTDKELPQIVMVSVDPERDTVKKMNEYVNAFNSHFIGIRGSMSDTTALENQLHIAAAKMQSDIKGKDHYTINHSAEIILFNPDAKVQAYFSFPHTAEQMVQDFKLILKSHS